MTPEKCTGFLKGIRSKTENIILLCRADLYILGYSLWFCSLQFKWDMKGLESKTWLLCASNQLWSFYFLNFSFLIYKIGLRGDRKKEGWGEGRVNKVLWGSWFIGQHIKAGKTSDFVAFESGKVNGQGWGCGEMLGILEVMGRVIQTCPKMLQFEFIKGTSCKNFRGNESK